MVDKLQSAFNTIKNNKTNVIVGTNIVDVARPYINDLNTLLDLLRTGSLYYTTDVIDGTTSWSPVDNTIQPFKGLGFKDAPDKDKLNSDSGIVVSVSNTSSFNYVVADSGYIAVKTAVWHYYEPADKAKQYVDEQVQKYYNMVLPATNNMLINSEFTEAQNHDAKWCAWENNSTGVVKTKAIMSNPDDPRANMVSIALTKPIINTEFGFSQEDIVLRVGATYTLSMLYKVPTGKKAHRITVQIGKTRFVSTRTEDIVGDDVWHRIAVTYTPANVNEANTNAYVGFQNSGASSDNVEFYLTQPMMSEGTVAVPWVPNPTRTPIKTYSADSTDFNTIKDSGSYFISTSNGANRPPLAGYGWLEVSDTYIDGGTVGKNRIKQVFYPDAGISWAYRVTLTNDPSKWGDWKAYYDSSNTVNVSGDQIISGTKNFTGAIHANSLQVIGKDVATYNSTLVNGNTLSGYDQISIGGMKQDSSAGARTLRFYSNVLNKADAHIQVEVNTKGVEFGSNMNIIAKDINLISKNGGKGMYNGVEIATATDINNTKTFATSEANKVSDTLNNQVSSLQKQITDLKTAVDARELKVEMSPWQNLTTRNGFTGFVHYRTLRFVNSNQTLITISGFISNINNSHVPNFVCDFPNYLVPEREIPLSWQQPRNNEYNNLGISVGGSQGSIRLNYTSGYSTNGIEIYATYWKDTK